MKANFLLPLLLLAGSAGVCAAQPADPPASAPAAAASAPAPVAVAPAPPPADQPPADPAPVAPVASPEAAGPPAGVVGYSGSMTTTMMAMTPGKAAFAMVGALAMMADGKAIIEANHIVDPSTAIAHDVAADLARARSARVAEAPLALTRGSIKLPSPEVLAAAAGGAAYVVDVDSSWSFAYFPTDWTHFRVGFLSRARLVDTATKKVGATHFCNWDSIKQGEPKMTHDELVDDGARGLKAEIAKGADFCRAEFKTALAPGMGQTTAVATAQGTPAARP